MQSSATSNPKMDIESDDSDRWEDFYGSTTELAPALLSIFDALNTSLEAKMDNNSEDNMNIPSQEFQNAISQGERKYTNLFFSPRSKRRSLQQSPPVTKSSCRNRQSEPIANIKHRNNIRLLSPNVQRIIAHSDAQHVESVNLEAIQQQTTEDESYNIVNKVPQNFRKMPNPIVGSGHKSKLSHIPLSKGAEKLTMAGNELVDTFDSSTEHLDTLIFAKNEPLISTIKHISASDDEKTPTNTNKPFTFEMSPSEEKNGISGHSSPKYIELLEIEKLASTTQLLTALSISPISKPPNQTKTREKESARETKSTLKEVNRSRIRTEAVNTSLINNSIVFHMNKTISRSQSLAHPHISNNDNDSSYGPTIPSTTPSSKSFPTLEQPEDGSTESLDRLPEMKSKLPTKEPPKMATLLLPEISKLKHRPLSSSSLCSTTSSSSSGSDNLNNKLSTSYLASVESLADHSESESTDQQASMSVLERSCLEIIDSERNYVEDLRQVITGYLCDWKERACLRVDELKVLFSNIEEIYVFSSLLLKHLVDASMDPVKIAQCFISMRESFNVYTKYCTSYPEAISLLTKLLQATHTNALLNSTQKMLQHTLPLGSYLLKPVQRILKYHLLLDNLRKHCDVKEVFQAYEIMRQVARNIDQVKRRLEQQSRVKELSGILDGWLGPELTVLGELRLEGLLMDHNKPRMVFLFATMLIITKPKEDNRLQFKSYIHQNNLMLNEHLPGEPTSFYVIPYDEPRNQIKLTAKNRDQKRVWTQQIKEAMLEKFENISSRAKELVYQLGDEEDRTSGKNSWKWTMNSTSMTPIYLERRNQYRRSELRNRFKLKRKSVADLSFANSGSSKEQLIEDDCSKPTKPLTRKNSLDESMVPKLLRLTAVRQKRLNTTNVYSDISQDTETNQSCSEHIKDGVQQGEHGSKLRNSPKLKERSKSVPRINIQSDEKEANHQSTNENHLASAKSMEIKQYNHKTMPKRVATIKKQKNSNSNKRDTFKFYMDISEFDVGEGTTVLKITESSEDLTTTQGHDADNKEQLDSRSNGINSHISKEIQSEVQGEIKSTPKSKRDAQIVFDLLKDSKEFERIYNKPQRKRSSEVNGQRQSSSVEISDKPPPPPSTSPPLLEIETEVEMKNHAKTKEQGKDEEHIYETLLRNVHVPYKFSPDFRRSKSVQYSSRREERLLPPRPESDYVILKYSADGTLLRVESNTQLCNGESNSTEQKTHAIIEERNNELAIKNAESIQSMVVVPSNEETITLLDVKHIPSSCLCQEETKEKNMLCQDQKPVGLVKRLFIAKNGYRISSLENISNAFLARGSRRKSTDNNSRYNSNNNRPPERRASDVSEMCRLAMIHRQGSEAVGERMAYLDYADPRTLFNVAKHIQRDSFFSLTSSNDSVCGQNNNRLAKSSTNFEYEKEVEDNLERDFRDSAIYSDDNEKRIEYENENEKEKDTIKSQVASVEISQKPPKLPPKPPRLKALASTPGSVLCPPHMDKTAARSWVLQQIENFSK